MSGSADEATRADAPFRLGAFEVRPEANELIGPRGRMRLPRLQMALLLRLVADAGRPVTRETLLSDVWPRRGVTDEVLSRAIADLRGVLGDDARNPTYLETLPKLGYRLKVGRAPLETPLGSATQPPAAPATPVVTSPPSRAARPPPARHARLRAIRVAATLAVAGLALAGAWIWHRGDSVDVLRAQLAAGNAFASGVEAELAPRFSPDGRRVAYAVSEDDRSTIVIRDRAGTVVQTIARDAGVAFGPVFFPDGERIAYWYRTAADCGIVERQLASGRERTLVPCADAPVARFDVAPDGRSLVFATRPPEQPTGLVHVDIASGTRRALTRPDPGTGDDSHPRFSPDGRRIAFFRGNDSQRELHTLSLAPGAAPSLATGQRGLSYGAAWLDDDSLLVAADWFGFRALNHVDLTTGAARVVGARGARFPDVDRRGDIVHENATYRANLWQVLFDSADGHGRVLWPSTRYTNQPVFAPDGRTVAFISNRDGMPLPYVGMLGGDAKPIASGESYAYMRPHWSRDGRSLYAIAMPVGTTGASVLVKIDVASGERTIVNVPLDRVWDASELDDGTLIVAESIGHAARLYRATATQPAKLERLPLPVVSQVIVAGARIAFSQPQLTGLTVCSWPALDCMRLDVPIGDANRFDWTISPGAAWFRDGADLVRIDLATRRETRRALAGNASLGGAVAIAPGEGAVILAREDRAEFDLMLAPR